MSYVLGPVTFEVAVDWRDEIAELLICRTVEARLHRGYVHDGKRIRIQLYQALQAAGLLDQETRERIRGANRLKGLVGLRAQLEACSAALQANLDTLLSRFDLLFPS